MGFKHAFEPAAKLVAVGILGLVFVFSGVDDLAADGGGSENTEKSTTKAPVKKKTSKTKTPANAQETRTLIRETDKEIKKLHVDIRTRNVMCIDGSAKASKRNQTEIDKINKQRAGWQKEIKKKKNKLTRMKSRLRSGRNTDGSKMTKSQKRNLERETQDLGDEIHRLELRDKDGRKEIKKLRTRMRERDNKVYKCHIENRKTDAKIDKLEKKKKALKAKLN
ncbi:hypothetical protein RXV86_03080 [Alisedimentitalea sp. MJ-SS2]|uniref:hypothetical protein n=1 Tax=Aliisedimentitalea sp. MJ-SS2 TaxID=3049795 RepID=UPI00290BF0FF|nr:hypothetical protein [Alisedimentitalea sp. MJ-SS2]MDU8926359.1 hypothetical protein [Alisedimentitalea sp. MJ-SS2]